MNGKQCLCEESQKKVMLSVNTEHTQHTAHPHTQWRETGRITHGMHWSEIFGFNQIIHELFEQSGKREYENEIRSVGRSVSVCAHASVFERENMHRLFVNAQKSNEICYAHMLWAHRQGPFKKLRRKQHSLPLPLSTFVLVCCVCFVSLFLFFVALSHCYLSICSVPKPS